MTGMALATNSAPLLVISWTSLVPSWACWCGCTPAKSFSPCLSWCGYIQHLSPLSPLIRPIANNVPVYKTHLSPPNQRGLASLHLPTTAPSSPQNGNFPKPGQICTKTTPLFADSLLGHTTSQDLLEQCSSPATTVTIPGGSLGRSYRGGCPVLAAPSSLGAASGRSSSARSAL